MRNHADTWFIVAVLGMGLSGAAGLVTIPDLFRGAAWWPSVLAALVFAASFLLARWVRPHSSVTR